VVVGTMGGWMMVVVDREGVGLEGKRGEEVVVMVCTQSFEGALRRNGYGGRERWWWCRQDGFVWAWGEMMGGSAGV